MQKNENRLCPLPYEKILEDIIRPHKFIQLFYRFFSALGLSGGGKKKKKSDKEVFNFF